MGLIDLERVVILSNSSQWPSWSMRMEDFLDLSGAWSIIEDPPKNSDESLLESDASNKHLRQIQRAQGLILTQTDYRLHHLLETPDGVPKHPRDMWAVLKGKFDRSTNTAALFAHYQSLINCERMNDEISLSIATQMDELGYKMSKGDKNMEEIVQAFFLRSKLPPSYVSDVDLLLSKTKIEDVESSIVYERASDNEEFQSNRRNRRIF